MTSRLFNEYMIEIADKAMLCIKIHRLITQIKQKSPDFDDSIYRKYLSDEINHITKGYNTLRQYSYHHEYIAFIGSFCMLAAHCREQEAGKFIQSTVI